MFSENIYLKSVILFHWHFCYKHKNLNAFILFLFCQPPFVLQSKAYTHRTLTSQYCHTFTASVGHTDFQTDSLMLSFASPPVLSLSLPFFLMLWKLHSHERHVCREKIECEAWKIILWCHCGSKLGLRVQFNMKFMIYMESMRWLNLPFLWA